MSPKYTQADLDRWIHDAKNVEAGPSHAEAPVRIPKAKKLKDIEHAPKVKTHRPKNEEVDDDHADD